MSVLIKVDPQHTAQSLQQNEIQGEMELDFSGISRIDVNAIGALEELAGRADQHSVRITLSGVNMDIYKVLKLMKLADRFGFLNCIR